MAVLLCISPFVATETSQPWFIPTVGDLVRSTNLGAWIVWRPEVPVRQASPTARSPLRHPPLLIALFPAPGILRGWRVDCWNSDRRLLASGFIADRIGYPSIRGQRLWPCALFRFSPR